MTKTGITAGALMFAACTFVGRLHGQTTQPTQPEAQMATPTVTPLAFEVVSVKPAPTGTFPLVPAFMRDKGATILGQQRMAASVYMMIGYAYNMQISEAVNAFRKQPDWTKKKIYTVTFRADGEPAREQVREMMRTMLAERFGLQVHEFTRDGMVNKLVTSKPGVLGPNLKAHPAAASCSTQESSLVGHAPDASKPPVSHCGFVWYYLPGMVMHVGLTDYTIGDAARALAGIGANGLETHPLVDATGLTGKYDLTLEFRPSSMSLLNEPEADDRGAPSMIQAMKEH